MSCSIQVRSHLPSGVMATFALLLLLLSTSSAAAQEAVLSIEVFEPEILLGTLFESDKYSQEKGIAWQPGIEEQTQFVVSDDGLCYTTIDTIAFFTTGIREALEEHALVLFSTNSYFGGELSTCHACAPQMGAALFTRSDNGGEESVWNLINFRKFLGFFGAWGEPGSVGIVKIGPSRFALEISSEYTGQGYSETRVQWFDIFSWVRPFSQLFAFVDAVGPAGCEEECDEDWCDEYVNIRHEYQFSDEAPSEDYSPEYYRLGLKTISRACNGTETSFVEEYTYDPFGYSRVCE